MRFSGYIELSNSDRATASRARLPGVAKGRACALALLLAVLALSPAAQAAGLEVSNLTNTSVRLTITDHSGDWSLQQEFGQRICLSLVAVTHVNAKGLQPGTSYTYGAYDGRGCTGSSIASATFTTKAPPAAPSISTVTGDNAKVTLTWTSGGDGGSTITKWQYRKADSGNWETTWTDICANTSGCPDKRSHTVANLTNGTAYRFRVRAVNVYGDGAESSPSDAVTPRVKTLTASNVGATTATLTIAHHTGDWHYQYTSPSGGTCSSTAVSGASVDLIDLLTATTYIFSAYSESTCATVIATADAFLTKPGKTTGVTVAAVNSKPKVSWTEVTGAASYKVQWKSGNENWDVSRQTTATTTSATLTSLTSSTRYTVRVAAVNATGDGAWSDGVQTLVSSPGDVGSADGSTTPSAPSKPAVSVGDRSVTLSWTAGGDGGSAITGWQYRRKAGEGEWEPWADVPGSGANTTSYKVTDLANGTAYRFKVRAVNAMGDGAESPESGTVLPSSAPPAPSKPAEAAGDQGWLARFGHAVGSQAVEMIAGRISSPAPAGARVTLAGVTLGGRSVNPAGGAQAGPGGGEPAYREMTAGEFLRRSSFHLASARGAQDTAGRWSIWGGGARTSFEGGGAAAVEGDVTAGMLGVDYEIGRLLGGVALSHAGGDGDFQKDGHREMEATLTSVHPYLRYSASERLSMWGVLGLGRGEMTLEEKAAEKKVETDIEFRMGALGLRGAFPKAGGFDLAVKSDVLVAQVDADAKDGIESISADTSRLRVLLEASREVATEGGGTFTPSLEAGLRHDGGDADEGVGVELGGGLRFTNPRLGLTVEIKARGLVTHEEDGMSDWGVGGTIRFAPGEAGRGFTFAVRPSAGETGDGAARLWNVEGASRLAKEDIGSMALRVRSEVGYGLDAWGGLLTPYAGHSMSEGGGGTWRVGGRFRTSERLSMSLEGVVRERAYDDPAHGLALRGSLRW